FFHHTIPMPLRSVRTHVLRLGLATLAGMAIVGVTSLSLFATYSHEVESALELTGQVLRTLPTERETKYFVDRQQQAVAYAEVVQAEREVVHAAPQGRGDNKMGVYLTSS